MIMTAKPCPNCGIMIYKTGGCSKVICSTCQFAMCWTCMQSYKNYRHKPGEEMTCHLITGVQFWMTVTWLVILTVKICSLPWLEEFVTNLAIVQKGREMITTLL